jgi:hypothetical protein
VRVAAKHVAVVPGTVEVRVKGGFRRTVPVRNGVAAVMLKGLPQGKRIARIAYSGGANVTKLVRTIAVRMPAPRR